MEHRAARLEQLSKGNQQLVQFLVAVLHGPELLVLDEPFSGLDPVNHEVIEREIEGVRQRGGTVVLSTHAMEQVERLCTAVALVNRSRLVFHGPLQQLKQHQGDTRYRLRFAGDGNALVRALSGLDGHWSPPDTLEFRESEPWSRSDVLREAMRLGDVLALEPTESSLRDIFIAIVSGGRAA